MLLHRMSQCVINANSYLMPLPTSPFVVSPLWNFFRSPGQYHFTVRGGSSCSDTHSMWNHCPKSHCENHQYNVFNLTKVFSRASPSGCDIPSHPTHSISSPPN